MTGRPEAAPARVRWSRVAPALALATAAFVVCGALGLWQWNRASEQGEGRSPDPAVPIAAIVEPASNAGPGIGRAVWTEGEWADEDVALVPDREVDGEAAVLVVRAFRVSADASGTGQEATLPVIVGWLAPEDVDAFDTAAGQASRVEGYLQSSEGAAPVAPPEQAPPDGAFWSSGLSPAVLAQTWESPLYSALLASSEAEQGTRALPSPEPECSLDFRSLTYALEWWLFGAFFVFISARWIRDNGRAAPASDAAAAPDEPHGGSA